MIVCTRCGYQNEDTDTFCGSCAGFLEWSGEKVAEEQPEAPPAVEAEPESEADRAGFIERVKDRIGIGDARPGEEGPDGAAGAEGHEPRPGEGGAPSPGPEQAEIPTPPEGVPAEPVMAGPVSPGPARPDASQAGADPVAPVEASAGPVMPVPPPPPAPAPAGAAAGAGGAAATAAVMATTAAAASASPAAASTMAPAPGHPSAPAQGGAPAPGGAEPTSMQPTATQPAAAQPAPTQPAPPQPAPVQPGAAQPAAVQPEAVKPTAVKARPAARQKTAPTRVVNPGDLVCGQCGEGNDPNRRFCRRCGASLQRAAVFTLPWYKRWWRRLTTRKTREAGDRPRNRRRAVGGAGPGWLTSGVLKVIGIAVVILVLLTIVGPWRGRIRHDVSSDYHHIFNDVHPTYSPLHPILATATSAAPGHPASFAIDGASNTSWQTNSRGDGVGQSLSIRLAAVSNVDEIGFLNGDQDTPQAYLTQPRPEKVHLTAVGAHPYAKDLTLKDTANFQTFTMEAKDATSLIITIDSVYPSDQGTRAAITEVELFVKT